MSRFRTRRPARQGGCPHRLDFSSDVASQRALPRPSPGLEDTLPCLPPSRRPAVVHNLLDDGCALSGAPTGVCEGTGSSLFLRMPRRVPATPRVLDAGCGNEPIVRICVSSSNKLPGNRSPRRLHVIPNPRVVRLDRWSQPGFAFFCPAGFLRACRLLRIEHRRGSERCGVSNEFGAGARAPRTSSRGACSQGPRGSPSKQ